jgi:hypothetical protein
VKALTLTQPWATLVAIGAKKIETRSWSTDYRGPLLIHAAKGLSSVGGQIGLADLCLEEPFHEVLAKSGDLGHLAFGAIVALVELEDVRYTGAQNPQGLRPAPAPWLKELGPREKAFGNFDLGRYGWSLRLVRRFERPIPSRGALGLWDSQLTVEEIESVRL